MPELPRVTEARRRKIENDKRVRDQRRDEKDMKRFVQRELYRPLIATDLLQLGGRGIFEVYVFKDVI